MKNETTFNEKGVQVKSYENQQISHREAKTQS